MLRNPQLSRNNKWSLRNMNWVRFRESNFKLNFFVLLIGANCNSNIETLKNIYIWVKVFKNGSSKICGRHYLKKLGILFRQTISLQICKGFLPQILLGPFLNTLIHFSCLNLLLPTIKKTTKLREKTCSLSFKYLPKKSRTSLCNFSINISWSYQRGLGNIFDALQRSLVFWYCKEGVKFF